MARVLSSFYADEDFEMLGQKLLGKKLFTKIEGKLTGGVIIETESYGGVRDKASHAYGGRRTKRNEVMYGAPGRAYVYLCYGMHALLNAVTGPENIPHAILIRALLPTHGIEVMQQRRGAKVPLKKLTSGPGSLTKALGISTQHNGTLLTSDLLWIEEGNPVPEEKIQKGPRIGIDYAGEDALLPYRYLLM